MPDDLSAQSIPGQGTEQQPADTTGHRATELPADWVPKSTFSTNEPGSASSARDTDPNASLQGGAFFDNDSDDEWQVRTPARRLRMRVPTAVLVTLLIAAGAFWGGAAVQRGQGTTSSGFSAAAASLRSLAAARGASGSSGFAPIFGGGGSSSAAVGTLTDVKGSTLYLTNSAGDIVTVVLDPSVKITRTASASASALGLGDTITVVGVTAKNGTVTATSITATAAGASTTDSSGTAATGSGD